MKKQIAILGSTGSIGTQALQVIEEQSDQYEAYVLTANNRVEELIAQARKFKPEAVVIANETKYTQLKEALADIDKQAEDMFFRLVKQLSEKEGVTEQLKAENQMMWVARMNNIRNRATEIVNTELIYK